MKEPHAVWATRGGPYRRGSRSKLSRLSRAILVVSAWCSQFAGFAVLGRQCRERYELGYWSTVDLHDVLNWWVSRPISSHQLEAGLLEAIGASDISHGVGKALMELDPVIRWLLDDVPLALWLIVVIPTILLLSSNFRSLSFAKRAKP